MAVDKVKLLSLPKAAVAKVETPQQLQKRQEAEAAMALQQQLDGAKSLIAEGFSGLDIASMPTDAIREYTAAMSTAVSELPFSGLPKSELNQGVATLGATALANKNKLLAAEDEGKNSLYNVAIPVLDSWEGLKAARAQNNLLPNEEALSEASRRFEILNQISAMPEEERAAARSKLQQEKGYSATAQAARAVIDAADPYGFSKDVGAPDLSSGYLSMSQEQLDAEKATLDGKIQTLSKNIEENRSTIFQAATRKEVLQSEKTAALRDREANMARADGVVATAGKVWRNPWDTITDWAIPSLAKSIPLMAGLGATAVTKNPVFTMAGLGIHMESTGSDAYFEAAKKVNTLPFEVLLKDKEFSSSVDALVASGMPEYDALNAARSSLADNVAATQKVTASMAAILDVAGFEGFVGKLFKPGVTTASQLATGVAGSMLAETGISSAQTAVSEIGYAATTPGETVSLSRIATAGLQGALTAGAIGGAGSAVKLGVQRLTGTTETTVPPPVMPTEPAGPPAPTNLETAQRDLSEAQQNFDAEGQTAAELAKTKQVRDAQQALVDMYQADNVKLQDIETKLKNPALQPYQIAELTATRDLLIQQGATVTNETTVVPEAAPAEFIPVDDLQAKVGHARQELSATVLAQSDAMAKSQTGDVLAAAQLSSLADQRIIQEATVKSLETQLTRALKQNASTESSLTPELATKGDAALNLSQAVEKRQFALDSIEANNKTIAESFEQERVVKKQIEEDRAKLAAALPEEADALTDKIVALKNTASAVFRNRAKLESDNLAFKAAVRSTNAHIANIEATKASTIENVTAAATAMGANGTVDPITIAQTNAALGQVNTAIEQAQTQITLLNGGTVAIAEAGVKVAAKIKNLNALEKRLIIDRARASTEPGNKKFTKQQEATERSVAKARDALTKAQENLDTAVANANAPDATGKNVTQEVVPSPAGIESDVAQATAALQLLEQQQAILETQQSLTENAKQIINDGGLADNGFIQVPTTPFDRIILTRLITERSSAANDGAQPNGTANTRATRSTSLSDSGNGTLDAGTAGGVNPPRGITPNTAASNDAVGEGGTRGGGELGRPLTTDTGTPTDTGAVRAEPIGERGIAPVQPSTGGRGTRAGTVERSALVSRSQQNAASLGATTTPIAPITTSATVDVSQNIITRGTAPAISEGLMQLNDALSQAQTPELQTEIISNINKLAYAAQAIGKEVYDPNGNLVYTVTGNSVDALRKYLNSPTMPADAGLQDAIDSNNSTAIDHVVGELNARGIVPVLSTPTVSGQTLQSITAAMQELSQPELAELVDAARGLITSHGITSPVGLVNAVIASDLRTEQGKSPTFTGKLSASVKQIITKIRNFLGAAILGIALNFVVSPPAYGQVTTTTNVQVSGLSAEANSIYNAAMKDAQAFMIVDKANGTAHMFDASGEQVNQMAALMDAKVGENQQLLGGMVVHDTVNNDLIFTNKAQLSADAITTSNPAFDKYIAGMDNAVLYVLPDQSTLTGNEVTASASAALAAQYTADPTAVTDTLDSSNPTYVDSQFNPANNVPINTTASIPPDSTAWPAYYTPATSGVSWGQGGIGLALLSAGFFAARHHIRSKAEAKRFREDIANVINIEEWVPSVSPSGGIVINQNNASALTNENGDLLENTGKHYTQTQSLATRSAYHMGSNLISMATPFLQFLHIVGKKNEGSSRSGAIPEYMLITQASNARKFMLAEMKAKIFDPFLDYVGMLADKNGMELEAVAKFVSSYASHSHSYSEGNIALRKTMVSKISAFMDELDAQKPGTSAYKQATIALEKAKIELEKHDLREKAAAAGIPLSETLYKGKVVDAKLSMGMTTAASKRAMDAIAPKSGLTEAELLRGSEMIYSIANAITELRVKHGQLTQSAADSFTRDFGFQSYVPQYKMFDSTPSMDVFEGGSALKHQQDFAREGMIEGTRVEDSLSALYTYAHDTATAISYMPFKDTLAGLETFSKQAGAGIYLTSAPVGAVPKGVSSTMLDNTGNRAYYFETAAGIKGADDLNQAIKNLVSPREIGNGFVAAGVNGVRTATRFYGKFLTIFRPIFPPINAAKDSITRGAHLFGSYFTTPDGTAVNPWALEASYIRKVLQYTIQAFNPLGGTSELATNRAFLEESGMYSEISDQLARGEKQILQDMKRHKGWNVGSAFHKFEKLALRWSSINSQIPIVASYAALIEQGVARDVAGYTTLQIANFGQQGKLTHGLSALYSFSNSILQDAGNTIDTIKTPRGAALAGGLVLTSIGTYAALSSLYAFIYGLKPGDDNPLDSIPATVLQRGIPIPTDDQGGYFLVPVGFGITAVTAVTGAMIHRVAQGKMEPGVAASAITTAIIKDLTPISMGEGDASQFAANFLYAVAPTILKPVAGLASNTNSFGGSINPNTKPTEPKYGTYYTNTPDAYVRLAKAVFDVTDVDLNPETYKHLADSYLAGPLSMITAFNNSDSAYRTGKEIRFGNQVADTVARGIGLNSLLGSIDPISRMYWDNSGRIDALLRKAGGEPTDKENMGDSASAAEYRQRVLAVAGLTPDQISVYEISRETDYNIKKVNQDITALAKRIHAGELSEESARFAAEEYLAKKEALMSSFNNTVQYLKWK